MNVEHSQQQNVRHRDVGRERLAKERLQEAAAAVRARARGFADDPRKLLLARVGLALLTILVLALAVRGIRSGYERIRHGGSSNSFSDVVEEMLPTKAAFVYYPLKWAGRMSTMIPFLGKQLPWYSLFAEDKVQLLKPSTWFSPFKSRRPVSNVFGQKINSGYDALKQSIDALQDNFKDDPNSAGAKAYKNLRDNFDKVGDVMQQFFPNVDAITPDSIKNMGDASMRRLMDAANVFSKSLGGMKDSFLSKEGLSDVAKAAGGEAYDQAVEGAKKFVELLSAGGGKRLKKAADKIKDEVADSLQDGDKDDLRDAYEQLASNIDELSEELHNRADALQKQPNQQLSAGDKARLAGIRAFTEAYEELQDAMDQRSVLQKIADESKRVFSKGSANTRDSFDNAYSKFKGVVDKYTNKASSQAGKGKAKINNAFHSSWNKFDQQLNNIRDSWKDAGSDIASSQPSLNTKVRATLQESYDALLRAVGKNPTLMDDLEDSYHGILQALGIESESRMERLKRRLTHFF